jgi:hypothetical protein
MEPAPRWPARLVRGAFPVLLLLGAAHACRAEEAPSERAWSVQLHLHGSFSEGEGSLDSHGYEATDVGCDVLWWSDHDFRITGHEHVSRFGFESWEEPLGRNEPWTTRLAKYQGDMKRLQFLARPAAARASFVADPVREGQKSLRLTLPRGEEPLQLGFGTERKLQRRPLASGLTLALALFPEALVGTAPVVVEVTLSEHAPRAGLGLEPRVLRYELASEAAGAPERRGAVYAVPVRCEPGRWNELALPLSADAVRGFPESPGEDNVLYRLVLGLDARAGDVAVCLDDLRLEALLSGPPVYARQAELIVAVGALYPALTQLQGLEVSYGSRHLNLFCEDTPLPDYDELARTAPRDPEDPERLEPRAFRDLVSQWVITETHARGGLVSYNHPFGATFEDDERPRTNEEQLAILLRRRAEGADLLEVGYRERGGATLDDHLWLWDQAALAGLRLVGTGVSDSHGGADNRWRGQPNNFVSWIYAVRPDKPSLIAGLRAGRVFFGDLERFDGTLDLVADTGERMGATLVRERDALALELLATGTKAGQVLVLVESGVRTQRFLVEGPEFRRAQRVALAGPGPHLVRIELHDETGPIALSNPIHVLRPER